ncbi:MAG TPA: DUF1573 domain-containing protein [Opitutaceae bacterium]|nr:DUF1573 domain-containing protein [Opitutaceae bacterium]
MTSRVFVFCFGFVVTFFAAAGNVWANLKATPAAVDFGKRRQELTITEKVKLTNDGKAPLEIVRVAADCSCTAATPSKTTLQPGESTDLDVSFETRSYQGEVHRRILVQTSEGDLVIPVQALVSMYDDWVMSAPLAILPASNRGESTSATIDLSYVGQGSVEVKELKPAVTWLAAEVAEQKGNTWKIKITKAQNAPGGNHQPKIAVVTSDAHEPKVSIGTFVQVNSTLDVRPNPLLMPAGKVGEVISMPFSIAGWEPKEDPRWDIDGGKVIQRDRDGRDVLLSLEVTATRPGTSTRLLRIYSGNDLEAEVPVIIRGE